MGGESFSISKVLLVGLERSSLAPGLRFRNVTDTRGSLVADDIKSRLRHRPRPRRKWQVEIFTCHIFSTPPYNPSLESPNPKHRMA